MRCAAVCRVSTLVTVFLSLLATVPATAQGSAPLVLSMEQALSFGALFPGQQETVSITDVPRRGVASVQGSGKVFVRFILPESMISPLGSASLGVGFGPLDAAVIHPQSSRLEPFDPAVGTEINLNRSGGHARVVIGGTVTAGPRQPAGSYSGTIVVVVGNPDI